MDTSSMIAADSSPYPEIRVSGKNKRFAEELSIVFGGHRGEFGTISEYTYQSIVFPEYADFFRKLAIVEMKHLDMTGRLIELLGGEVVYGHYRKAERVFWSGADLDYTRDLPSALIHDLNGEQRAYAAYVKLARQSGDRYVFSVLTRIALDEMFHAGLLKAMIAEVRNKDLKS